MRIFVVVSNVAALLISVFGLFIAAMLRPEISVPKALLTEIHDIELNSATSERRNESVRNLLALTEVRLRRAATVTNACLLLGTIGILTTSVNLAYLRRRRSATPDPRSAHK